MKKLKIGDVVKIKDEHKRELRICREEIKGLEIGLRSLSMAILEKHRLYWKTLTVLYPEIKGFNCKMLKDWEIRILEVEINE